MRAPIHPAGGRPSAAKGEGGDPRKGRGGQPPTKANKAPKSKGSSKGHQDSAKRLRRSSPGPNSVEVGRGDKTPPARSPTREPAKRRPVSAPPGKGPQAAMTKKTPKTDRRSPSKQPEGSKSPQKTKKASSMPSSRASSSSSVKRSQKSSASEVILANGERTEVPPSGEDTTLQQRIAKSIEAVISTLGKEAAQSPTSRPPSRPPDAKEKPKSTAPLKSKLTGAPKEGVLEGGKDAPPLERDSAPKKRGRPKGSKNKVKKEGKKVKGEPRKNKGGKPERPPESRSLERVGESLLRKKGRPEGRPSKVSKKTTSKKKVVSSKVIKGKDAPSRSKLKAGHKRMGKVGSAPKVKTKAGSGESSPSSPESDEEQDGQRRGRTPQSKGRAPKSRPQESPTHEKSSSTLDVKAPKKARLPSPAKSQSKGGKSPHSEVSWKPTKEPSSSASDEETEVVARPPKKAINEKWSQHLRKAAKAKDPLPPSPDPPPREAKATSPRQRRERFCYFSPLDSDLDSDSEYSGSSSPRRQKQGRKRSSSKGGGKRKKSADDLPIQAPKRTAKRMASLNALVLMSLMMEDSKVPLPSPPQPSPPAPEASSMALVLRESTIAHSHSGDDSDDSEEGESERLPSPSRVAVQKRKAEVPASPSTSPPTSSSSETKAKARRGEVDLTMDMRDMLVTKRLAWLDALAKMAAASCTSEPRRRRPPPPRQRQPPLPRRRRPLPPPAHPPESEVTNVDIKRKISTEASKSVITVHETTKKVKKAGATEVEERIVVKKKSVRRQGAPRAVAGPVAERDDDGSDQLHLEEEHLLAKSPEDDPGLLLESTLTLATPPTAPGTVTLSGVSKYLITSADGRTTTVVQQVQQQQRQAPATTAAPSSPGGGGHLPHSAPLHPPATIPKAHIPPTHHVQVPHHEGRGGPARSPASYSPLGALEVMQPLIHPHHPPPPSAHFLPYPPSHGAPLPHPHHVHHHPPPHLPLHHHAHPSPPYPPLSPHSPPYPPPPSPSSEPPHPCHPPGYRSPPPCSNGATGFPSPVSSPKQSQGVLPFRDPTPNARVYGPPERHQSAFSAPMSSAHAPAATVNTTHGYLPVSGPIPTGGPPNTGSYKPPQSSPGGGTLAPPPYSSPSRLTSPPPTHKPTPPSSFPPHHESYASPPHPYHSYPYSPPVPPYDKYYPRTPPSYHLYPPSYPGAQYPPQGEFVSYQPPPPGTVHYSQESYTSYTFCVPAPPAPHGSPQAPVTNPPPSALALPPPPPTSHHHSPPYPTYHCPDYPPIYPYPSAGPSQNVLCCPAGSSKNVPPGPLTATSKGPGSEYGLKKLPPLTNAPVCPNNYHGGSKAHLGAQGPPGNPHANQQSLIPTPPPSVPPKPYTGSQPQETPPRETPTQQTPLTQQNPSQERRVKDSGCVLSKSRCPEGTRARVGSPLEDTQRSIGGNHKSKPPPALSPPRTPTSTSSSTNGLECQFPPTSGAAPRGPTHPAPSETSLLTLAVSLSHSSPHSGIPGANKGPVAPRDRKVSASGSNDDCSDSGDGSVGLPPTPSTGNRSSPSGASSKALDKSASSSSTSSPDLPTTRACGLGPAASAVPVFPAMPDGSRALQITKWVVQSSASPLAAPTPLSSTPSCPDSRGEVPPPHQGLLSPTGTTTSISPSNTNASTNSVMSTTAPIVASLERTVRTVLDSRASKPKEDSQRDVRWKEAPAGREPETPASQRTGGRHHLLCHPVLLSHIKMPSVQAKAKPSPQAGATGKHPAPDEVSHKDLQTGGPTSSTITRVASPVSHQSGTEAPFEFKDPLTKEASGRDKEMMLPRKRVRPPKNRDTPSIPMEAPPSNGAQEKREHFWCAPGETNIREDAPRRSSGAKPFLASLPSSPKRAKGPLLPTPVDGADPQEGLQDIKISVKTEAIGKIKTEKISPRQAIFRDHKPKPLNGDTDATFGAVSPKDIKTLLLPPPSLNLGSLDPKAPDGLKTEVEADLPKSEEKKVCLKRRLDERGGALTRPPVDPLKGSKVQKPLPGRGKSPKVKLGRTWPKVRKKASLLAYLKERNNESDASNGEGDAVEDELRKLIEKDDPKSPSPFTGYPPLSVRGRRISGAGRGKSVRKPRCYHGWSWEGDPHESKVWLRNDEMLMMRRCYKAMRHKEGDTIRVRDCVLLRSGPRKTDLPFVAKVASLWEDPETNDMMMSILWYYRPEHTDVGRREEDLEDEIFASKHRDHLSVACIEDRCYVLTFNEYCRCERTQNVSVITRRRLSVNTLYAYFCEGSYRRLLRVFQERLNPQRSPVPDTDESYLRKERQPPGWVVPDLLFFCRKVYDYRQKRILKNPC